MCFVKEALYKHRLLFAFERNASQTGGESRCRGCEAGDWCSQVFFSPAVQLLLRTIRGMGCKGPACKHNLVDVV